MLRQETGVVNTFGYDAAGNRTRIADGHEWADCQCDTLSQMIFERRWFDDPGAASTSLLKAVFDLG